MCSNDREGNVKKKTAQSEFSRALCVLTYYSCLVMTWPALNTKFHFLKLCRVSDRFSHFLYVVSRYSSSRRYEIVMYILRLVK